MLGLGFSADLAFAGAPCEFLLNSAEGGRVDDGRVAVFHIVFRAFTVVDSDLFADAVGDVGLIDDGIAFAISSPVSFLYSFSFFHLVA